MSRATGRRVARILWPLMLVWAALLSARAYGELNDDYVVAGLYRTYRSPYRVALGAVIDPRPALRLGAEIRARYAPDGALPAVDPSDAAGWTALIEGLGLRAQPFVGGHWGGAPPRLRITADGPQLLIGLFGVDPVALVPGLGVVRIAEGELPPATVDLALVGAKEPPW